MTDDFIAQERKNVAEIYLPNTDTWVAEIDGKVEGFIALMGNEVEMKTMNCKQLGGACD